MRRFFQIVGLIVVNLVLLAALLAAVEWAFRIYEKENPPQITALNVQFYPYIMYWTGLPHGAGAAWHDVYRDRDVPTDMQPNNLGFSNGFDFELAPNADYLAKYGKKPGERIVLFTGGSAAHGVGASSNAATIAGRMEHYLNAGKDKVRYRVISLGMGSWVSFQELIALQLWGRQFEPDWIVVMDGVNDAAAFCAHSAGVGRPMLWPTMLYYLRGQVLRNRLETFLAHHSAIWRLMTGHREEERGYHDLARDPSNPDYRFRIITPTAWDDFDRELDFYIRTEATILHAFPDAKFILSTQPTVSATNGAYLAAFSSDGTRVEEANKAALEAQLAAARARYAGQQCSYRLGGEADTYFMPKSALALAALVARTKAAGQRDVGYINGDSLMPPDGKTKNTYFVDDVHMADSGQDIMGKAYAEQILARDSMR